MDAANTTGWIKVSRKIGDNWLWDKRPFSYGHAWVDLLLLANHKDGFFFVRDIMVEVKRGQVGCSILTLSKKWGWSRTAVETFLNRLEIAQQIAQQRMKLTTLITIINYDTYQETAQQIAQQESNRSATEAQQQRINKNDKNEKNVKKNKKDLGQIPPKIEEVIAYCQERGNAVDPHRWFDHYEAKGWLVGKTKMVNWKAAVRTWEKGVANGTSTNAAVASRPDRDAEYYNRGYLSTVPTPEWAGGDVSVAQ